MVRCSIIPMLACSHGASSCPELRTRMEERHLTLETAELDLLRQLAGSEWTEIAIQQGYDIECNSLVRISGAVQATFCTTWKWAFSDDHELISVQPGSPEITWQKDIQSKPQPMPWRVVWSRDVEGPNDFQALRQLAAPPRSLLLLRSCFDDMKHGSDESFGRVYIHDGVLFQKEHWKLLVAQGGGGVADIRLYTSHLSIEEFLGLPGYVERRFVEP